MRGKDFHNALVDRAKTIFTSFNWQVDTEHRYRHNNITTYFDLYAVKANLVIACEIETTPRHVIDNVVKALATGVCVWVVVPTRVLLCQAKQKLASLNISASPESVRILLFSQLEAELKFFQKKSDR